MYHQLRGVCHSLGNAGLEGGWLYSGPMFLGVLLKLKSTNPNEFGMIDNIIYKLFHY